MYLKGRTKKKVDAKTVKRMDIYIVDQKSLHLILFNKEKHSYIDDEN
jgi:hypothetical protein